MTAESLRPVHIRRPRLQDDPFLDDVRSCPKGDGHFRLWWVGQAGFLLGWDNTFALLDPYLSDSLTRKYAGTGRPHLRMMERVIDPARLDFVSLTTSSHGHTDHQDSDTLRPLVAANPAMRVVAPKATEGQCRVRTGIAGERLILLDRDQTVEAGPFRITAFPSAHETLEYDDSGACRFLGYVIRFGPWTVYHSGDTVRYEGMAERLATFGVDLALLPINGRSPERGVAGNLDAREAAQLGKDIGAAVIPCHYDMFEFNTADPEKFRRAAAELGVRCFIPGCGERWESSQLDPARS